MRARKRLSRVSAPPVPALAVFLRAMILRIPASSCLDRRYSLSHPPHLPTSTML
ncbi:hypothetical protein BV25DRAFT_1828365 [Artomyces pyxidatus]|uniref:Uncharacterized protein n=1 Tax=Artomyces pyxidatus TaxID=48021 RepID=A0ACB8SU31_9AGAM|nr:hypothetical protein BV25DRAFT_1828365 [Artomyces pyxidatus]